LKHICPHPFGVPHGASAGQLYVGHWQAPSTQLHDAPKIVQSPTEQRPPHPSGAPHMAVGEQVGVHTQRLFSQCVPIGHPPGQLHVSSHVPFTQTRPGAHVTPAQGSFTQVPLTHCSFAAHVTPVHGFGGTHPT
jgi:hypothetical protein